MGAAMVDKVVITGFAFQSLNDCKIRWQAKTNPVVTTTNYHKASKIMIKNGYILILNPKETFTV